MFSKILIPHVSSTPLSRKRKAFGTSKQLGFIQISMITPTLCLALLAEVSPFCTTTTTRTLYKGPSPVHESSSRLFYAGDGKAFATIKAWNDTVATRAFGDDATNVTMKHELQLHDHNDVITSARDDLLNERRDELKRELARVAITNFHPGAATDEDNNPSRDENHTTSRNAEVIMKELEQLPLPIQRPATHPSLNTHWSFVFTGGELLSFMILLDICAKKTLLH